MIAQRPDLAHRLLDMITESTIGYLQRQIDAGVHLIQVFDSWAAVLDPEGYAAFSLPYLDRITRAIHHRVPVTLFAKGANFSIAALAGLPCHTIGLDWTVPAAFARSQAGDKTLQGNLDPAALYAPGKEIVKKTRKMLEAFGNQRHIANLGHGVYPDTDPEAVKIFVNTVKEFQYENA